MKILLFLLIIATKILTSAPVSIFSDDRELCRPGLEPTNVKVGLEIISISDIDEPKERFIIQGILHLQWNDYLNSFNAEDTGCDPVIFEEDAAREALNTIWWPDPDFRNGLQKTTLNNQILTVFSNGDTQLQMLIEVSLKYFPKLQKFPFDTQNLSVIIEPFGFSSKEVIFKADSAFTDIEKNAMPVDWQFNSYSQKEQTVKDFRHSYKSSQIIFNINTSRKGDFYIWRLLIPMVLIVMVTWTVFWMVGEKLNDRIKVIAIGLLSAVSFAHFLGDQMPEIPYLTFLDSIFISSLIIVFISVIESLFSYTYAKKGKIDKAHKIDKSFRFIMPAFYFLVMYLIYEYYF